MIGPNLLMVYKPKCVVFASRILDSLFSVQCALPSLSRVAFIKDMIEKLHNKALRIISFADFCAPSSHLFMEWKMSEMKDTCCLFYKHSVFQSEAQICLSFPQIQPQNMLI